MSYSLVVVGAHPGDRASLEVLCWSLPSGFSLPIVVLGADRSLATLCPLPVEAIEDKQPLAPGRIYLCPEDYHVLVDGNHLALSADSMLADPRPSIEALFSTAAACYGDRVLGILMSHAGVDGERGSQHIENAQGRVITQAQMPAGEMARFLSELPR